MTPDEAPPRPDEAPEEADDAESEDADPRHGEGAAQKQAPADHPQPQATGHPENAG